MEMVTIVRPEPGPGHWNPITAIMKTANIHCRGADIQLHQARIEYLRKRGIKRLPTNCDAQNVICWNERHFGFCRTGKLIPKPEDYDPRDKDYWFNLFAEP